MHNLDTLLAYQENLNSMLSHPSISGGGNGDAHAYTRTYIREQLPRIQQILTTNPIHISSDKPHHQVLSEIENDQKTRGTDPVQDDDYKRMCVNIETFLSQPKRTCPETQFAVDEALALTWAAACAIDDQIPDAYARDQVYIQIQVNTLDEGGCIPGFMARLFSLLAPFTLTLIENRIHQQLTTPLVPMIDTGLSFFEETQAVTEALSDDLALKISLEESSDPRYTTF
ncbi:MAG: hypothetical protein VXY77_00145 [Pseudomonadota bacterium]|nr:hypothetical protein [Pseudomonadota bacterium]